MAILNFNEEFFVRVWLPDGLYARDFSEKLTMFKFRFEVEKSKHVSKAREFEIKCFGMGGAALLYDLMEQTNERCTRRKRKKSNQ